MPLKRILVVSPQVMIGNLPAFGGDILALSEVKGLLYGYEGHNDVLTYHSAKTNIALTARDEESPVIVLGVGAPDLLDSTKKVVSYLFEHTQVERVLVVCTQNISGSSDLRMHVVQFDSSAEKPKLLGLPLTTTWQRLWLEVVSCAQAARSSLSRQAA
jgi:hypothetical protein